MTEKLFVAVTFDPEKGYVGAHPDLRAHVVALSLSGLRRRLEDAHRGKDVEIKLILDRRARFERDQRRRGGASRIGDYSGAR